MSHFYFYYFRLNCCPSCKQPTMYPCTSHPFALAPSGPVAIGADVLWSTGLICLTLVAHPSLYTYCLLPVPVAPLLLGTPLHPPTKATCCCLQPDYAWLSCSHQHLVDEAVFWLLPQYLSCPLESPGSELGNQAKGLVPVPLRPVPPP